MKHKKHIMRTKQIYIGLIVLILGVFAVGAARAQPQQPSYNQGLLSKLIEIKYTSELYLSSVLKQGSNKDSALANYNTLRWKLDGFVYQLSADMIAANSPRKMILLNAWCLEETGNNNNDEVKKNIKADMAVNKKIQVYTQDLTEIENFYQNQILPSLYKNNKTINLSTNVFYLLKDSYTIVNGISNMKTEKTMALIELLDHTRLLSPGELTKQGK
jgi:signal transduction histidine kinase